ncbi:MAG TPA: AI-2E family transporter [Candidatus Angelobacter sp.]|nr:AI-2E family transporter [Candidatus Angelobacter sp.]
MPAEDSPIMGSVSQGPQIDRAEPDHTPQITTAPPTGGEASESVPPFDLATFLLLVISVVLAIYTLYFGRVVIIPLMVALLLKLVLSPLVSALSLLRVPEWAGAALVLTAVVAGVGYGIFALSSPAAEWVGKLPEGLSTLESHLQDLKEPLAQMQKTEETISKLSDVGPRRSETIVVAPSGLGAAILSETTNLVVGLSATLVLLYFLLSSGDFFLRKLVTVLPRFGDKKHAVEIAQQVQSDISHYLLTVTAINIALGVVVAGALYALGMPSPALWGTMAAVLNFIPFLGHVVGFSVIGLVALMSFGDLETALIPPAVYACLAFLEGQFITPAIVARRLTLNRVAVFVALIFWGWLWMIPGMLLAVPMLAVFKIFCDHIRPLKPIGEFLGH